MAAARQKFLRKEIEKPYEKLVRSAGHLNGETERVSYSRLDGAKSLREDGRLMGLHQLSPFFVVELILDVVDCQLCGTDGRTHTVAGHARVGSQRIGAAQLVHISGLQLLSVFEPLELRSGESDHFAFKAHQSLFRQNGLQLIHDRYVSAI